MNSPFDYKPTMLDKILIYFDISHGQLLLTFILLVILFVIYFFIYLHFSSKDEDKK